MGMQRLSDKKKPGHLLEDLKIVQHGQGTDLWGRGEDKARNSKR